MVTLPPLTPLEMRGPPDGGSGKFFSWFWDFAGRMRGSRTWCYHNYEIIATLLDGPHLRDYSMVFPGAGGENSTGAAGILSATACVSGQIQLRIPPLIRIARRAKFLGPKTGGVSDALDLEIRLRKKSIGNHGKTQSCYAARRRCSTFVARLQHAYSPLEWWVPKTFDLYDQYE